MAGMATAGPVGSQDCAALSNCVVAMADIDQVKVNGPAVHAHDAAQCLALEVPGLAC